MPLSDARTYFIIALTLGATVVAAIITRWLLVKCVQKRQATEKAKQEHAERARLTEVAASLTPEEWRELLKFEGRETATLDLDSSEAPVRSLMRKHLIGLPYPYLANLPFAPKSLTQDGYRIVMEGIRP